MLRGKRPKFAEKIEEVPAPCLLSHQAQAQQLPDAKMAPAVKEIPAVKELPAVNELPVKEHPTVKEELVASQVDHTWINTSSPTRSHPRHRPAYIQVRQSNGRTALTTAELKQRICDSRNDTSTTITQIPIDKREKLPPTPTSPFNLTTMGNKASSIAAKPNDPSQHTIPRNTKPVSRKGSFNVFKRVDSRSPLQGDVIANVTSVMHQEGHQRHASAVYDDEDYDNADEDAAVTVVGNSVSDRPEKHDHRFTRSHVHSLSATTITEDKTGQSLSASTTIRDFRLAGQGHSDVRGRAHDKNDGHSKPSLRNACLSPTLPAPSPLPEDSPHKYGLRDKMDTPELPANPVIIPKARRKSSGLEIFNEAKSLQSAASFLNGLSTSRRRAESAADTSTSSWTALNAPSRPSSTRPSSTRPSSGYQDGEGRRNGHNFKSSGFAYTRPLTLTQIKCFRGHSRLLVSRNKNAPVECAVCHIDDDGDHFSCSWCALRMCKYCRQKFAERGISAIREAIKTAELGSSSSENSSNDSLVHHARGRSTRSGIQFAY